MSIGKQVTLTLHGDLLTFLLREAEENERPLSRQIRHILREYAHQYSPSPDEKMPVNQSVCASCRYFTQHYIKGEAGWFDPVNCGHCTKSSTRRRKPSRAACNGWCEK